jgi:hypothetical protein
MPQDKSTADQNLQLFIEEVAQHEVVWGLHCKQGWANADSHEFDDTVVYTFWSNRALAKACAVEEWSIFRPETLALPEFLENWCVGMYKEYIMAGTNWDSDLFGKEIEPLELAFKILDELNRQGKKLKYKLYKDQIEFETMLKDME